MKPCEAHCRDCSSAPALAVAVAGAAPARAQRQGRRHRPRPRRARQGGRRRRRSGQRAVAGRPRTRTSSTPSRSLALELNRADLLLRSASSSRSAGCRRCRSARATRRSSPAARGYLDCSQFVRRLDVPTGAGRPQRWATSTPAATRTTSTIRARRAAVARGIAERLASSTRQRGHYRRQPGQLPPALEGAAPGWETQMAPHGAPRSSPTTRR